MLFWKKQAEPAAADTDTAAQLPPADVTTAKTTKRSFDDIDAVTKAKMNQANERIAQNLNVGSNDGTAATGDADAIAQQPTHRHGRPKPSPHGRETQGAGAVIGSNGEVKDSPALFMTDCKKQHAASLQCIERNYDNRGACQPLFQAYKDCRKAENERRHERNAALVKNKSWW
eukprot:CAMPEP_0198115878 /NCGR_PEP_ID=MMETSP1442-20131203/7919_1 /TAXON_ID= /ORGANISM="Craspedostauros australis, Strain CCMP3328" /LENGTH=172 /DNA_ID=CAMNT_0043773475 /DNA_START=76 /DNA_END=594 /DNA_ORIENTATION=-